MTRVCGSVVLVLSLQILDYWVFGRIFCDIWAAVDVLCCTASIMSLCVISIDRYIGVRWPLQYPTIVTEKRALLAMLGIWVLAIVISIGPLFGWKQPPSQVEFWQISTQTILKFLHETANLHNTLYPQRASVELELPMFPAYSAYALCHPSAPCNSFQFSP